MAHINFLEPPRFSLRQFNLKSFVLNYFWMMVIAGLLLLFMFIYGAVQRSRVASLNSALTVAIEESKKASGAQPAKSGAPQKATIMDALQQRVIWSPILNAIANHTPDTVSLNYIKGNATGTRTVQLEGVGADVLSAARYKDDLSTVPFFSKVALQSSSSREIVKSTAEKEVKADTHGVASSKSQLTFEIQGWLK